MSQSIKVACIGECMIEMAPANGGLFRQGIAGDTYNTAVYLKRQFFEQLHVSYISALGLDGLSNDICQHMADEGVDTSNIRKIENAQPGLYLIENDATGERFFSYWRATSAARSMFKDMDAELVYALLKPFSVVFLSGITLAILDDQQRRSLFLALARLKREGAMIALDPNYRPQLWDSVAQCIEVLQSAAQVCTMVLSTFDDDIAIWQDTSVEQAITRWSSWGIPEIVIKDGANGCTIVTANTRCQVLPIQKLTPVDTTGAGDSFCAGYVGARALGALPEKAAALAHRIAGQVIMYPGGVISKNSWQVIENEQVLDT